MMTVNTIKGQPHIQSALQVVRPSRTKLRTMCAVLISAFLLVLQTEPSPTQLHRSLYLPVALRARLAASQIALESHEIFAGYPGAAPRRTPKTTSTSPLISCASAPGARRHQGR